MKCKAAEVLHDRREQACGADYGFIFLDFIDCMVSEQMMVQYGWRQKRLQWLYDTERHFISDYIGRYAADGGRVKDAHQGYRDKTGEELMTEAVETAQERVDRELSAIGFDYDPAELVPSGWKNGWKRQSQSKAALRMAWYATNGGRAARMYLTSLMQMFHDDKGFGAVRLRRIFEPVAAEIRWYLEKFFVGTDACDLEIKRRIEGVHKRLEEYGLEMVQVPASDAVRVRKKEAKPEAMPEGMAELAWDKLKGSNVFGMIRKVY